MVDAISGSLGSAIPAGAPGGGSGPQVVQAAPPPPPPPEKSSERGAFAKTDAAYSKLYANLSTFTK